MNYPKKDPIVDKLADEIDLNKLFASIISKPSIIKCFLCNNLAMYECILCDSITCNDWLCCPHPKWYRRFRWWLYLYIERIN